MSVVEECGCEGSCYRAALLQHLYNYTSPDDPEVQVSPVLVLRLSSTRIFFKTSDNVLPIFA